MNPITTQLQELFLANASHAYLKTFETDRALSLVDTAAASLKIDSLFLWNAATGIKKYKSSKISPCGIENLLDFLKNQQSKSIVIIKDAETVFSHPEALLVFQEIISQIKLGILPVVLVSISYLNLIPYSIQKDTYIVNVPLPTKEEILAIIKDHSRQSGITLSRGLQLQLANSLSGLTTDEIITLLNRTVCRVMITKSHIGVHSLDMILEQKKQVIKKSGIVEYIDDKVNIDAVGGLTRLKRWLKDRKNIFDDIDMAKKYGVKPPKGLLLFGAPGSGKSLIAKVIATYYNLPLLRVDMGLLFGQKSPEEAMMRALALADSLAPCVFFIDEVEKALSGSEVGASDPTAVKILGTLLTWMQERTAPVFIVATANDISMLRPETYRDGRIDEIFFLGFLEYEEQISQIINIHLKAALQEKYLEIVEPLDYALIKRKMDQKVAYYGGSEKAGYSGANMERLVLKVLEDRYFRGKETVDTKDFLRSLETLKPQHGIHISTMLHRAQEMDAIIA